MKFQVKTTPDFERSLKKIAKKHKSIYKDILDLITILEQAPKHGTELRENLYKIRMAITGVSKGKSGGARVITYVKVIKSTVFLTEIYLKTEYSTVDEAIILSKLADEGLL